MSTKKSKKNQPPALPEPAEPDLLLTCPPELSPKARAEWDRIMLELPRHVLITNLDGTLLALFCDATVQYWEAKQGLEKLGPVLMTPNGHPMQSPYVGIAHHYSALMIKLANELGLSPASRRRLPGPPQEYEEYALPALKY